MATLVMPVRADIPEYKFQIELEETLYTFNFRYNQRMDRWIMDLLESDETPIVIGIPLLTEFNLFKRFRDSRLPVGDFYCLDESGEQKQPGREDLGNDVKLFYIESA